MQGFVFTKPRQLLCRDRIVGIHWQWVEPVSERPQAAPFVMRSTVQLLRINLLRSPDLPSGPRPSAGPVAAPQRHGSLINHHHGGDDRRRRG